MPLKVAWSEKAAAERDLGDRQADMAARCRHPPRVFEPRRPDHRRDAFAAPGEGSIERRSRASKRHRHEVGRQVEIRAIPP
jgi:hypothetical protein